jgi:hypothetical protein
MNIGYFHGLKGYDAVLISCGQDELDGLRGVAREAVSSRLPVSITDYCFVSQTIPADLQLFAAATGVLVPSLANRFVWRIDSSLHSSLDGLLEGLVGPTGHQYFDLDGRDTILVVSVGEYDDNWWHSHAEAAL